MHVIVHVSSSDLLLRSPSISYCTTFPFILLYFYSIWQYLLLSVFPNSLVLDHLTCSHLKSHLSFCTAVFFGHRTLKKILFILERTPWEKYHTIDTMHFLIIHKSDNLNKLLEWCNYSSMIEFFKHLAWFLSIQMEGEILLMLLLLLFWI